MILATLPSLAMETLLQDAARRDPATARRCALLRILLHERYLTREQLVARVEGLLGRGCFGDSAWEDNFYRDMRVVKAAFKAAGHQLVYSRSGKRPGYYLQGEPEVSAELSEVLRLTISEVDRQQLRIFSRMTPAERFRLGCSISDTARQAVAYRIRQRNPGLTPLQANYMALQGSLPK